MEPSFQKVRKTITMLFSWLLFGICLAVIMSEIFGINMPAFAHQEPQQIIIHRHGGVLDLQSIWNEMEGYYYSP